MKYCITHKGMKFRDGDKITCTIKGIIITDAKIHIISNDRAFICQNRMAGKSCMNKFGYTKSWVCTINSDHVTSGVSDLKFIDGLYDISEKISGAISRAFHGAVPSEF